MTWLMTDHTEVMNYPKTDEFFSVDVFLPSCLHSTDSSVYLRRNRVIQKQSEHKKKLQLSKQDVNIPANVSQVWLAAAAVQ